MSNTAVGELIEALRQEGTIRAIDSGRKASDWRNCLSSNVARIAAYKYDPPARPTELYCTFCDGSGKDYMDQRVICINCDGTGRIPNDRI